MNPVLTVKLETELGDFVDVLQDMSLSAFPDFVHLAGGGWEFSHVETTLTTEKGAIMQTSYPVYTRSNHSVASYLNQLQNSTKAG